MKKLFTLIFAAIFVLGANAQDCTGGRYYTEIFTSTDSVMNVTYGVAPSGQSLEFDVWYPNGDVETNRPVIILAHGGSFIGGDKSDATIRSLCNHYARMGYVAASMEYRLLPLDSVFLTTNLERTFLHEVYRAVHDQMALIRYFRKNHGEGNTYGINPNLIIVGGISAGSILSVHTAYMNDPAKLPSLINEAHDGGFYGASGNAGFSSVPQAVINYCGAVKDTSYIIAGSQPMVSVHGDADAVVPYGTAFATPMPGVSLTQLSGSGDMKIRADHVGVDNPLLTYVGAGHCEFWTTPGRIDTTTKFVDDFLEEQICIKHLFEANHENQMYLSLYPNPTSGVLNLDIPSNQLGTNLQIMNAMGAVVYIQAIPAGVTQVSLNAAQSFAAGVYWLKVQSGTKSNVQKFIVK